MDDLPPNEPDDDEPDPGSEYPDGWCWYKTKPGEFR